MCGIVGYIGNKQASEVLLNSLSVLEYRGYDSAGIAVVNGQVNVAKSQGKLINLKNIIKETPLDGSLGIGHTRWATHGVPSQINAHPHTSQNKRITLVHNGIISNYLELKSRLIREKNLELQSETDTEIIANLLEYYLEIENLEILPAISKLTQELQGNYALCIIDQTRPSEIFLTNDQAPLIIGLGDGEVFCASDSSALLEYTDRIVRLKDKQIVHLEQDGKYTIYNNSQPGELDTSDIDSNPTIRITENTSEVLNKNGFRHFLMKEIHEQPDILRKLYSYHYDGDNIVFPDLDTNIFTGINKILITGCGTAYHAGMIGKYLLETLAKIPAEIEFASELLSKPELLVDENTLVIAMSQSGETADTLMAVRKALAKGAKLIAVNNRPDSTLVQLAENASIFTQAGIEVSVAATKSFMAQMFCLYTLAIYLAEQRDSYNRDELNWLKEQLHYQPSVIEQMLTRQEKYQQAILPYAKHEAFIFLGRGVNYTIALEGALKLKEITYVQATGYASGEMKHGPIATLDQDVPTIGILLPGITHEKTLHNMLEAKTRGSANIAVVLDGDTLSHSEMDTVLEVPLNFNKQAPTALVQELINPFAGVVPLQLISYYLAEYLGKDVDQPRNLAKSVTVE